MASLRTLAGHAEDIDVAMKRVRGQSVEVDPRADDMRFCILLEGQETAVDVYGKRLPYTPRRAEFADLLDAFKSGCSEAWGVGIADRVINGTETAALVYDMKSGEGGKGEILAIATFKNTMTSPSAWIKGVHALYEQFWRGDGALGSVLLKGDASLWKPAVDAIVEDGLHFYFDLVCSSNSVDRQNGGEVRRGAGSFLVAKVAEYIDRLFIQPAIKMATFEQWTGAPYSSTNDPTVRQDKGGDYERRINAMSLLDLQSLPKAEGFWRDNMKFVQYDEPRGYAQFFPQYMRYVNLPMQPKITKFAFDPPPPDTSDKAQEPSVSAGSQTIEKVPRVIRIPKKAPVAAVTLFYANVEKIASVFVAIFFAWHPETRPRENMTPVALMAWIQKHTTPVFQTGSGDIRIDIQYSRPLPKKTEDVLKVVCKFMWLMPRYTLGSKWSTPDKPTPQAYKALFFEIRSAVRQNTSSGMKFMNRTPEELAQLRLNDPTRGMTAWAGAKGLSEVVEKVVSGF